MNINNDALMNAWMGWELLNADEAVDISYWDNYEAVHQVIPLGSLYEDIYLESVHKDKVI